MIYKGDIGTLIKFETGSDILSAITTKILFRKPNNDTGEWIAEILDETTIGYYTQENDLDVDGVWRLQVYIETPLWKGYGQETQMKVLLPVYIQ